MWRADFELIAGAASVVGLFFSWAAWRRAKSAEVAADRAREAVRRSNAGEDMRELTGKAQDLLACAQSDQFEGALLRSRDLLAALAQARQRWEEFFGKEGATQVEKAAKEVGRISRALSAGRPALTPQVRDKLLRSCHEVAELLASELGKILRRAEGGTDR